MLILSLMVIFDYIFSDSKECNCYLGNIQECVQSEAIQGSGSLNELLALIVYLELVVELF